MPSKWGHRTPISASAIRKVSVLAPADPRSVRKLLWGKPVSPMTAERITRALKEMGLDHLVPH